MIKIKNDNIKKLIKNNMTNCNSYWKDVDDNTDNIYAIYDDSLFLGLVEYTITSDDSMYIEMIELVETNRGVGSSVIDCIFVNNPSIKFIDGNSLYKAINFWSKIGAKFEDDIEPYSMIPFMLSRHEYYNKYKKGV